MASLTVAAVVISRGNAETLNQTLSAVQEQSHPLQQVVVVETDSNQECIELARSFGFAAIASEAKKQGQTIDQGIMALQGEPTWLWILHHDTAPEPKALAELSKAAEISPSVAVIGPKLLDWEKPIQIRQLGLTVTKSSRPFTLVEDEYDQGQFDTTGDTLAVSTAGMLVAMGLWQKTGGIDDESPSYAQDIEFCIKARAMGYRVIVEPGAKVRSGGALTSNLHPAKKLFGGRAEALAKAHTHLATILWPGWLLPLLYLAMPLIAVLSIPLNLFQKRPARIIGQFSAWLYSWFTISKRLAARKSVRSLGSLNSLPQLYATNEQISNRRARRFEEEPEPVSKAMGIWESKSIWLSLIPLAISFALIPQGAIYAERLVPLGRTLDSIWLATSAGTAQYLSGIDLPSDPFNWFFALVSLIWPSTASQGLGWFLLFAPSLAFIGSWLLISTISTSGWVRNSIALSYALAAPVLLMQRDAAIVELVLHASLPWASYFLVKSALAFNLSRSWRWLGLAGLTGALVAVSSPVVFGFLVLFSIGLGAQRVRRLGVLVWFFVPGAALLGPWLEFVIANRAFEFLTVSSSAQLGPSSIYEDPIWLYLLLGLAVIALAGSLVRIGIALPLWIMALALLYASSVQPVLGSASTLVALLLLLLVLVALGLSEVKKKALVITGAALLSTTALSSGVVFGVLQPVNFEFGVERQVPALVLAASDVDPSTRTLVIQISDSEISADYLWGDGRSQEELSVLYDYFRPASELDGQLAQLAGSLIAGNPAGVAELNRVLGVDFVLLVGQGERLRQAGIALDSLTILQPSGQTSFGQLWSFIDSNDTNLSPVISHPLRQLQLAALAAFALLAIPTPASITGKRRVRES